MVQSRRSAPVTATSGLPEKQTCQEAAGMSQMCHGQTWRLTGEASEAANSSVLHLILAPPETRDCLPGHRSEARATTYELLGVLT